MVLTVLIINSLSKVTYLNKFFEKNNVIIEYVLRM